MKKAFILGFILFSLFANFNTLYSQTILNNIISGKKVWVQISSFNRSIFTNADSVNRVYSLLSDKRKTLVKIVQDDFNQFLGSIEKNAFETTADFELRKQEAIKTKKLEIDNRLRPLNDELFEFEDGFITIDNNRFNLMLDAKDYNADLKIWNFKIKDNAEGRVYDAILSINPSAAEKIWNNRELFKLRQLKDIQKGTDDFIWLDCTEINYDSQFPVVLALDKNYHEKDTKSSSISSNDNQVIYDIIFKIKPVLEKDLISESSPISSNNQVAEEETDKVFTVVQIPSTFPGGTSSWTRYLERTLNRDLPVDNGAPGGRYAVTVTFIVARDGSISDVRAENNPGYGTAEEAVRVISKGPRWTPAEQNGHKVIYRHRQSIVFMVTDDDGGYGSPVKMKKRKVY